VFFNKILSSYHACNRIFAKQIKALTLRKIINKHIQLQYIYTFILLLSVGHLNAQTNVLSLTQDSTLLNKPPQWMSFQDKVNKIINKDAFQMTYIGVPLIIGGLIIKKEDDHFRNLRNSYIPYFKNHYDDYLQYSPGVAMFALKACGVEGRSSWERMLVSDFFSVGLMAASVNATKYTMKVPRPDGSTHNSFPSGHTATAFMFATMLHKEYGLTQSPWYSIGGYSAAAATAVTRIMNNRHWLSDIMVGAGIGVISTEIGYLFADLIFKDKGLRHNLLDYSDFDYTRPPSFFGLSMGFNLMPRHFSLSSEIELKASPGSKIQIEGAWFKNRYFGIGGELSASSMPLSLIHPIPDVAKEGVVYKLDALESGPLDIISTYVGPYLSFPLTDHCLIGSKLLTGVSFSPANSISAYYRAATTGISGKQKIEDIKHSYNIGYETGISVSYIIKPKLSVRVYTDYNFIPSRYVGFELSDDKIFQRHECHEILHMFAIGASINVLMWN